MAHPARKGAYGHSGDEVPAVALTILLQSVTPSSTLQPPYVVTLGFSGRLKPAPRVHDPRLSQETPPAIICFDVSKLDTTPAPPAQMAR
jgi:hypothetical protein